MARKKKHEEHENLERWLVSYADFITLLFAFFVVMYALSSVNEGKFRVLSESLISAFKDPTNSIAPIVIGETPQAGHAALPFANVRAPIPQEQSQEIQRQQATGKAQLKALKQVAEEVEKALSPLIKMGVLDVRSQDLWVEIEIKAGVLFESASAQLTEEAQPILSRLSTILKGTPFSIRVEGHTDDLPIYTDLFRSNWELSGGRAASVVRLFEREGVDPARMALVGFGEQKPKVPNDSDEHRNQNRRVVLVVMADQAIRDRLAAESSEQVVGAMDEAWRKGMGEEAVEDIIAPTTIELPPPPIPLLLEPPVERGPRGEPLDVTSRAKTDRGLFPVIQAPIRVPANAGRGGGDSR